MAGSGEFIREELIRQAWGQPVFVCPRIVDVYIARPRKKFLSTIKKDEAAFYLSELARGLLKNRVSLRIGERDLVMTTFDCIRMEMKALDKDERFAVDIPIRVPTCIIWGEEDRITPPEVGRRFHALIPESDLFLVPRCGHAPMLEQPEAFNAILAGWLLQRTLCQEQPALLGGAAA